MDEGGDVGESEEYCGMKVPATHADRQTQTTSKSVRQTDGRTRRVADLQLDFVNTRTDAQVAVRKDATFDAIKRLTYLSVAECNGKNTRLIYTVIMGRIRQILPVEGSAYGEDMRGITCKA